MIWDLILQSSHATACLYPLGSNSANENSTWYWLCITIFLEVVKRGINLLKCYCLHIGVSVCLRGRHGCQRCSEHLLGEEVHIPGVPMEIGRQSRTKDLKRELKEENQRKRTEENFTGLSLLEQREPLWVLLRTGFPSFLLASDRVGWMQAVLGWVRA